MEGRLGIAALTPKVGASLLVMAATRCPASTAASLRADSLFQSTGERGPLSAKGAGGGGGGEEVCGTGTGGGQGEDGPAFEAPPPAERGLAPLLKRLSATARVARAAAALDAAAAAAAAAALSELAGSRDELAAGADDLTAATGVWASYPRE